MIREELRAGLTPTVERRTCQPCPIAAPPTLTHLSAVVLQDLAHHGDHHLAQVTRDPLLLRKRTRWDAATAPGHPPTHTLAPQILTLHPQNSPLVGIWEYPGVPALYRSPSRHIAAQEHQRILPWVPSIRAGRLGFSPQPHVLGQDGHIPPSSCIPPPPRCGYPQGLVPDSDPAELQCPTFGRRHHVPAPVLRSLAAFVEGAGPGCRWGRRPSAPGVPRDHLQPCTDLPTSAPTSALPHEPRATVLTLPL